jgi:propanol-preferring alcohol dehydrogenase
MGVYMALMTAMVLDRIAAMESTPLTLRQVSLPIPRAHQVQIKISASGICHTELDEIEGRLPPSTFPMILGHEIIGRVTQLGTSVNELHEGDRVGVTWLYQACGHCSFCRQGTENLCAHALWTGKDVDGGYAEYIVAPAEYVYHIPRVFTDIEAAPLMCAGIIGYRALRLTQIQDYQTLGLYGFGASAHIVIQITRHLYPHSKIYVFTRSPAHRQLAQELGAAWTGSAFTTPPAPIHAAIDFTPAGQIVREALRALEKGGRLVINAIRKMNPIPELDYVQHLWYEKEVKSVANVTKRDAIEFLPLAAQIPIRPRTTIFQLADANEALLQLKQRKIQGAGVFQFS